MSTFFCNTRLPVLAQPRKTPTGTSGAPFLGTNGGVAAAHQKIATKRCNDTTTHGSKVNPLLLRHLCNPPVILGCKRGGPVKHRDNLKTADSRGASWFGLVFSVGSGMRAETTLLPRISPKENVIHGSTTTNYRLLRSSARPPNPSRTTVAGSGVRIQALIFGTPDHSRVTFCPLLAIL